MVTITLYARQQKRYRCIEVFWTHGRRQGWDDLREYHWNMYIIICKTDRQSRFDVWDRVLRAGALGWPRGMGRGRRWEGFRMGDTHVHPWLIHVNVWQKPPEYCKVISLQIKFFKKEVFFPLQFFEKGVMLWHTLCRGWTSKTLCWVNEATHKRPHNVWFHW